MDSTFKDDACIIIPLTSDMSFDNSVRVLCFPNNIPDHITHLILKPTNSSDPIKSLHSTNDSKKRQPTVTHIREFNFIVKLASLEQLFLSANSRFDSKTMSIITCNRTIDTLEFRSVKFNLKHGATYSTPITLVTVEERNNMLYDAKNTVIGRLRRILEGLEIKRLIFNDCDLSEEDIELIISSSCNKLTSIAFKDVNLKYEHKEAIVTALENYNSRLTRIVVLEENDNNSKDIETNIHDVALCSDYPRKDGGITKIVPAEQDMSDNKIKIYLARNESYQLAHDAVLEFLCIKRYISDKSSLLIVVDKNIVLAIAKRIYNSRNDRAWLNRVLIQDSIYAEYVQFSKAK